MSCKAELCPMWGGDDCMCEMFDLDPDNPPRNGTFSTVLPSGSRMSDDDYAEMADSYSRVPLQRDEVSGIVEHIPPHTPSE